MFDWRYRFWLIKYLASLLLAPTALLFVCVRVLEALKDIPGPILVVLFITFPLIYWIVVGWITEWQDAVNARKLGAKSIPLIKGRRFGNMDVVARRVVTSKRLHFIQAILLTPKL